MGQQLHLHPQLHFPAFLSLTIEKTIRATTAASTRITMTVPIFRPLSVF